jgi:hypothetical protein
VFVVGLRRHTHLHYILFSEREYETIARGFVISMRASLVSASPHQNAEEGVFSSARDVFPRAAKRIFERFHRRR